MARKRCSCDGDCFVVSREVAGGRGSYSGVLCVSQPPAAQRGHGGLCGADGGGDRQGDPTHCRCHRARGEQGASPWVGRGGEGRGGEGGRGAGDMGDFVVLTEEAIAKGIRLIVAVTGHEASKVRLPGRGGEGRGEEGWGGEGRGVEGGRGAGDMGDFVVLTEEAIAKGIRRIVAVTGHEASKVRLPGWGGAGGRRGEAREGREGSSNCSIYQSLFFYVTVAFQNIRFRL